MTILDGRIFLCVPKHNSRHMLKFIFLSCLKIKQKKQIQVHFLVKLLSVPPCEAFTLHSLRQQVIVLQRFKHKFSI